MRCMWPGSETIRGEHILLEPLALHHAPMWRLHHQPDLYEHMSTGGPDNDSLEGYQTFIQSLLDDPDRYTYAIRVGEDFAGRISVLNYSSLNRSMEVGTLLVGAYHGTFVNPESKYLLLKLAFEELDLIRVQFKVDMRNVRSQRAIEKMGAVREGTFRHYQVVTGGHLRDSVIYSLIPDDWPAVRVYLEERLAQYQ